MICKKAAASVGTEAVLLRVAPSSRQQSIAAVRVAATEGREASRVLEQSVPGRRVGSPATRPVAPPLDVATVPLPAAAVARRQPTKLLLPTLLATPMALLAREGRAV